MAIFDQLAFTTWHEGVPWGQQPWTIAFTWFFKQELPLKLKASPPKKPKTPKKGATNHSEQTKGQLNERTLMGLSDSLKSLLEPSGLVGSLICVPSAEYPLKASEFTWSPAQNHVIRYLNNMDDSTSCSDKATVEIDYVFRAYCTSWGSEYVSPPVTPCVAMGLEIATGRTLPLLSLPSTFTYVHRFFLATCLLAFVLIPTLLKLQRFARAQGAEGL